MDSIDVFLNEIREVRPEVMKDLLANMDHMDELEKVRYLQGVLFAVKERGQPAEDENVLSDAVHRIPTKYTDRILLCLYQNEKSYHGDLAKADAVQLTNSGLTAVMKKIESCRIPVVRVLKEGKYKIYSLTREGKHYVENNLLEEGFRQKPGAYTGRELVLNRENAKDKIPEKETSQEGLSPEIMKKMALNIEQIMESKVRNI